MRKLSFQNFLTCHFLCNKISLQFSLNDVSSSIVITFLLDSILRLKEEFLTNYLNSKSLLFVYYYTILPDLNISPIL